MTDLKRDYKDYLVLLSFLAFALFGFAYFGFDRRMQSVIIIASAFFYIFWGIIHHSLRKDFHFKVLLEYLVLAFFGAVLVLTLLQRV